MAGIAQRVVEWRRLTKECSPEKISKFLQKNPDVRNLVEALTDGQLISFKIKHPDFESELIKKIRKCEQLIEDGVPEKVATFFMFKNPDFLDLKTRDIYYTYQYAISRGVTKTAAAVIASTDYFGRGGEGALDLIISNYFTQRALYGCSTNLLDIDFLRAIRYKKLYRFPEARLAFSAIGDFEDMLGDYD